VADKPVDIIELPSQGLLYDGELREGKVTISPMGTKEESLLVSRKGRSDAHLILDKIIARCLQTSFNLDNMLVADRFYILLMIRNLSYGSNYGYKVKCPECGEKFKKDIRIPDDFTITILDEGVKEPFYADLPRCRKRVGFHLLRVEDEKAVEKYTAHEYRRSQQDGDPGYIYRLARHIVSIDDIPEPREGEDEEGESASFTPTEVNLEQALELCETLIGIDSSAFKDAIAKNDCGVNLLIKAECPNPNCGDDFESLLKFTPEFFRPVPAEV